jgi:hypothetical protein
MADLYELVLALDLRGDLAPDQLAELRWHVGQGERPEKLVLGTDVYLETFPLGDPGDPDCGWETAEPAPAFATKGPASRVGGALVAALVPREKPDGWALTLRQELHPDQFYDLRAMLGWLGRWAVHDGPAGHLRFHENTDATPLMVHNGRIEPPDAVVDHTPLWQGD